MEGSVMFKNHVGEFLQATGKTVAEMSKDTGIHRSVLSKLAKDTNAVPSLSTVNRLAFKYGIHPFAWVSWIEPKGFPHNQIYASEKPKRRNGNSG